MMHKLVRYCWLFYLPVIALGAASAAPPHVLTNLIDGVGQSHASGKPLLVIAGQDWCPHTKKVQDEFIGKDARVQSALNGYVVVELNGPPSKHLVGELRTNGYPTVLVYSHNGSELWRAEGEPPLDEFVTALTNARSADSGQKVALHSTRGLASSNSQGGPDVNVASMPGSDSGSANRSEQGSSAPTTTIGVSAGKTLDLKTDLGDFVLTANFAPERLTRGDGISVRFATAPVGDHISRAIASDGTLTEVGYASFGNTDKISSISVRAATDAELAGAGFQANSARGSNAIDSWSADYRYDSSANLIYAKRKVSQDVKEEAWLSYDSTGNISRLQDGVLGAAVSFTYNAGGKPTLMQVSGSNYGFGELAVTYDANDKIANVKATTGAALKVTEVFQDLLDSINATRQLDNLSIFY